MTVHTVEPGVDHPSVRPLPDAELARRLHRVMEIYPETATADVLAGRKAAFPPASGLDVRKEPWVTWLRILREHPAASARELEPAAVAALVDAGANPDPGIRDPALEAIAALGPKASAAVPALQRLLEGAAPDLRRRVEATLEAVGAR